MYMKKAQLVQTLHRLAREHVWGISGRALGRLLEVSSRSRTVFLARASREGFIQRLAGGFYRNCLAELPSHHMEQLANWLRPEEWFYLSLESALHEAGYLPQVPNRLTFVTTGRSYVYHTPLGTLEFTHTARPFSKWQNGVFPDWKRGIRIAQPDLALRDLRYRGRNVDLVIGLEG